MSDDETRSTDTQNQEITPGLDSEEELAQHEPLDPGGILSISAEHEITASGDPEGQSVVSAAKLKANRENAKKSTGPRTLAGKARSSQNSLKHGRYSGQSGSYSRSLYDSMRELGEDPEEFAKIEDGLRTSFLPTDESQKMLLHEIALLRWQRRRLERAQAALLARRIQKLEIERERESLRVHQTISAHIPDSQLTIGLLWEKEESPTKFQKLLEWLETLQGLLEAKDFETAEAVTGWIYGVVPTVRGALIRQLFRLVAKAAPEDAEEIAGRLRMELLREISDVTENYNLYLREHTDLTATMREECMVPTEEHRWLMRQMYLIDRQIELKIRLQLTLKKIAEDRDGTTEKSNGRKSRKKGQETLG
ncbi:MAG TPA: hypothetical protein VMI06_09365 [Terriglobia bacterium]|nr:hypothetical protein [Terriglobia bacterium]